MGGDGTDVKPQSLDDSANTLLELSALLQAGRPELELTGKASSPAAHEDVANKTKDFAQFAHDQYEDVVALLAALSMKLKSASSAYTSMDQATKRKLDDFLANSTYKAAG
jgi:hypothetical protein